MNVYSVTLSNWRCKHRPRVSVHQVDINADLLSVLGAPLVKEHGDRDR